ncbi:Gfo/Idh/MocA family oxidoreductase [Salinisphaera sp. RV14]|uniref:Gfo/Idh/MocA family oxidoreductase n=1 Tax=Salinisphaera sp. RV14 TaxID=3454140 RepID=UPI003F871BBA
MRILIIGLGYAGRRFLGCFHSISQIRVSAGHPPLSVAAVNRSPIEDALRSYSSIPNALKQFAPDIVVVSASDGQHFNVLRELDGYSGFVICEKPLVNYHDDLFQIAHFMRHTSGFCLDLVERYSDVTSELSAFAQNNNLELARAHFIWGKDRINDHRSTSGAVSEIIHPLDLVEHVVSKSNTLSFRNSVGMRSDFSISGDRILDSLFVTTNLGRAVVSGYSSFVNIERQRTLDFIFISADGRNVFARAEFDTPAWDYDALRIWNPDAAESSLLDLRTDHGRSSMQMATIAKLSRLVQDVLAFVENGKQPTIPFCCAEDSIRLQQLLNVMELRAKTPAAYQIRGFREPLSPEYRSAESLG